MKQFTGKSEAEALENALKEENCSREDFTYALIDEEKHLFGLGNIATIEGYSKQDVKEFIFNYLGAYFTDLDLPVSIEIILEKDDSYKVILDSQNNAILIGRSGQTLRAITTVLRAAVNAEFNSAHIHNRLRILVDVNNYREDRYRKVKITASKIAKEVRESHIDASLDPMPSDERKIIHQYLDSFKNISTISEGEGRNRHIVIRYTADDDHQKETD